MVKAIIEDRKTMTRRIVKYNKIIKDAECGFSPFTPDGHFTVRGIHENGEYGESFFKLKYQVGEILWVRETWQHTRILNLHPQNENYGIVYRADNGGWEENCFGWTWKPSIFMPKEAARHFLKVVAVRIEKLHDITAEDIKAEGVSYTMDYYPILFESWQELWIRINGQESWDSNPYVFVYKFEKVH